MKQTETLVIGAASSLEAAARVIKNGGIAALPTETFYGLAVNPFDKNAVKRLFELKGRDSKNPISLIIKDEKMLGLVAADVTPIAKKLMAKFWPGPLTLVFSALSTVPEEITASSGKIGVRVSSSPVVQSLMQHLACPITATSANPSGLPPAKSAKEVLDYFNGLVDVIIDGGALPPTKPSTVADVTAIEPIVLRPGVISITELNKA